ncbi:MAG TPA: 50S ribosomal protein L25 [Candidatus Magasanikbacteria bacterium]|nr:50S ribosomal protein L25 [Candidatus Magasanikbacteria bacterium]
MNDMVFSITAHKRGNGDATDLRQHGFVPGVIYGPDREPMPISVDALPLKKLYNEAGESSLVDFVIEGESEPVKVLIQDIQFDPVKGTMMHVDFRQIRMGVEMHATTELIYVGVSPAVKELGGTLVKVQEELDIKCLPKDLVSHIDVDLSVLCTFDDAIHIGDLKLPAGVIADEDPNTVIAKVTPPLTEDQLKAIEQENTVGVEAVEVEEKGKKEEEGESEAKAEDKKE